MCGAATLRMAEDDPKEALRFAEIAMAEREALSVRALLREGVDRARRCCRRPSSLNDHDKAEGTSEDRFAPTRSGRRTRYFTEAHAARIEARSPDRPEDDAERLFRVKSDRWVPSDPGAVPDRGGAPRDSEWLDDRRARDSLRLHRSARRARSIFDGSGSPSVDQSAPTAWRKGSTVTS